jgi:hypothetical protein
MKSRRSRVEYPENAMQSPEIDMSSDEIRLLLDERALKALCVDYALHADARDGVSFAKLFTSDAVLEGSGLRFDTPEAIREVPDRLRIYNKTYHLIHNLYIYLNGDEATGTVYSSSHHLKETKAGVLSDTVMHITYRDSYLRQIDGWKFRSRILVLEFSEERAVSALTEISRP